MFTISKQFEFSASHQLNGLPEDHPCSRLHGHNYKVIITLESDKLDEVGFVRDYRDFDCFKKFFDEAFDHRHLNDVIPANPTAESLAVAISQKFNWIPELISVTVQETDKTSATFTLPKPAIEIVNRERNWKF